MVKQTLEQTLEYFKRTVDAKTMVQLGFAGVMAGVLLNFFIGQYTKTCDHDRELADRAADERTAFNERIAVANEKGATAYIETSRAVAEIATVTRTLEATNRVMLSSQKEQVATTRAVTETQNQACQAAKKASTDAALVLDEMKKQNPIMVDMASSGRERTRLQAEMLAEHKLFKPAIEKMAKEASEERKEFWGRSEKHEAEVRENQKKILDRLPPKPASPATGVVPK